MKPVYQLVRLCEWLDDVADLELRLSLIIAKWISTSDLLLIPHGVDKHTTIEWWESGLSLVLWRQETIQEYSVMSDTNQ